MEEQLSCSFITMRIDKFLKSSRIIKRRQVAKAFCDADKVKINDIVCKPSSEIEVGDLLSIQFGSRIVEYRVLSTQENLPAKQAKDTMVEEV